jgi:hypothetical protein
VQNAIKNYLPNFIPSGSSNENVGVACGSGSATLIFKLQVDCMPGLGSHDNDWEHITVNYIRDNRGSYKQGASIIDTDQK